MIDSRCKVRHSCPNLDTFRICLTTSLSIFPFFHKHRLPINRLVYPNLTCLIQRVQLLPNLFARLIHKVSKLYMRRDDVPLLAFPLQAADEFQYVHHRSVFELQVSFYQIDKLVQRIAEGVAVAFGLDLTLEVFLRLLLPPSRLLHFYV